MTYEDAVDLDRLKDALGWPSSAQIDHSRQGVSAWFKSAAPGIAWDVAPSPVGDLYVGVTSRGVCSVMFGATEQEFIAQLDRQASTERLPNVVAPVLAQLLAFFNDPVDQFDIPIDLSGVTVFQRNALETVRQIPKGRVWTYKQLAEAVGRPKASRAIGQAMARNPVPLIIPCHRVVGSSGALTGYGGGGGIATKRMLLQLEGAL